MSFRPLGGITLIVLMVLAARTAAGQAPRPTIWIGSDIAVAARFTDEVGSEFSASKVQVSGYTGGFSIPFLWGSGRTLLIAGASYRMRRFHSRNLPLGSDAKPADLHELATDAMVRRALGERWALIAQGSAGLASDFVGTLVLHEALRYQGAVLLTRSFSPRLTLGAGAAYGNAFSLDFPLPLLSVDWNDGGRWRFSGTLPADFGLWLAARPEIEFGLRGGFDGATYTTRELFPAAEPRLQYVAGRVGPSVQWRMNRQLTLAIDGGVTWQIARLHDGGKELSGGIYDLRPTLFTLTRLQVTP